MFLQRVSNAGRHEIHDGLRRIDDSMRVSEPRRVSLKKLLVYGIEEVLLVGKIRQRAGGIFNGDVEAVQALEVIGAAEALANEPVNNVLYLTRDDVPLN